MTSPSPWLIAVDMQSCFAEPDSPWCVPGYDEVEPAVQQLLEAYGARSIVTRYVSPKAPAGAWDDYFRRWPGMLLDPEDPAWRLTVAVPAEATEVVRATFSKWDVEAAAVVSSDAPLVVCGVATEACVLATVTSAVDDGRHVILVPDACRGATAELHTAAIRVLESFSPQVRLVALDQAIDQAGAGR